MDKAWSNDLRQHTPLSAEQRRLKAYLSLSRVNLQSALRSIDPNSGMCPLSTPRCSTPTLTSPQFSTHLQTLNFRFFALCRRRIAFNSYRIPNLCTISFTRRQEHVFKTHIPPSLSAKSTTNLDFGGLIHCAIWVPSTGSRIVRGFVSRNMSHSLGNSIRQQEVMPPIHDGVTRISTLFLSNTELGEHWTSSTTVHP